jgi:hypothetical protein
VPISKQPAFHAEIECSYFHANLLHPFPKSASAQSVLLRHWLENYRIAFVEINVEKDEQA